MANKFQDVSANTGVAKAAEQSLPKDEPELHGAKAGCKNWEERDNCEIFAGLAPGVQCPKCKFWTKNSGPSD